MKGRVILGLIPALVFAACSGDTPTPSALDTDLSAAFDHKGEGYVEHFTVCKTYVGAVGPAVTVDWSVERASGTPAPSGSVVLADGQCAEVYEYVNDGNSNNGLEGQTVTATERPVLGYTTSYIRTSRAGVGAPIITEDEMAGNSASGVMLSNPDNGFQIDFINTAIPSAPGRMTGGGSAFTTNNVRITHGFELRCNLREPNRLEVNWQGNRFHMTSLTSALCTDNPAFDEGRPVAGFDTFDGTGLGRYNGVDGFGIQFQFVDDGEPGTGDIARIQITDGATVVMTVGNYLDRGNHQAHR